MKTLRMLSFSRRVIVLAVVGTLSPLQDSVSAALLYQSASLGPTGIPWSDFASGAVPGSNVNSAVFLGARFHLSAPAMITGVGGHFVGSSSSSFFGALVKLDGENDFPDSANLMTPDVVGTAALSFPSPSHEVSGQLTVILQPGWYAIVFGSGYFGATGAGGATRNNSDVDDPSFISYDPNFGWFDLNALPISFRNYRFVVSGQVIAEPSSMAVVALILLHAALRTAPRAL